MRDGAKLFTAVYVPKDDSQTYPILLMRTPYSCQPYGVDKYPNSVRPAEVRQGRVHLRLSGRARPVDVRRRVRQHAAAQSRTRTARRTSTRAPTPTTRSTGCVKNVPNNNGKVGHVGHLVPRLLHRCGHDRRPPGAQGRLAAGPGHRLVRRRRLAPQRRASSCRTRSTSWPTSASRGPSRPRRPTTPFDHGTPDGYDFFLEHGPARERRREVLQGRGRRSGTR